MTITITTSLNTLMQKAQAVGKAKKGGTPKEIKKAKADLKNYENLVLKSDSLFLNCKQGELQ